jgi:glycerophosphoryl diester phosphodiesterase
MKSLRPEWTVGLLTSVAVGGLMNLDADFYAVNASLANRRFIRSAHEKGKKVHAWTVNDAATMSTMMGRKVDNLITDKPALARAVLRQRATMSAPERLLLELAGFLGVRPELGEP